MRYFRKKNHNFRCKNESQKSPVIWLYPTVKNGPSQGRFMTCFSWSWFFWLFSDFSEPSEIYRTFEGHFPVLSELICHELPSFRWIFLSLIFPKFNFESVFPISGQKWPITNQNHIFINCITVYNNLILSSYR